MLLARSIQTECIPDPTETLLPLCSRLSAVFRCGRVCPAVSNFAKLDAGTKLHPPLPSPICPQLRSSPSEWIPLLHGSLALEDPHTIWIISFSAISMSPHTSSSASNSYSSKVMREKPTMLHLAGCSCNSPRMAWKSPQIRKSWRILGTYNSRQRQGYISSQYDQVGVPKCTTQKVSGTKDGLVRMSMKLERR